MTRPHILFISHEATRTGAPVVLLSLLKWLRAHTDLLFEILLNRGGELESDFRALAPCMVYADLELPDGPYHRMLRRLGLEAYIARRRLERRRRTLLAGRVQLVYANTITNADLLGILALLGCPVITHVHELEYGIQNCAGPDRFRLVDRCTTHYIACSNAVKENLLNHHGVPAGKIDVVTNFLPAVQARGHADLESRLELRKRLDIPSDAFVVCACGHLSWLKGPDLFLQLARQVRDRYRAGPLRFLWVGGGTSGPFFGQLQYDLDKAGLSGCVAFTGPVQDPSDYFIAADVIAVMSREESFSLVMLEAGSLGKPVVCFADSGNPPEFLADDCGVVVPYLDVIAMAAAVLELAGNSSERQRLGQQAARRVRERHTVDLVAPRVLEVITRFL